MFTYPQSKAFNRIVKLRRVALTRIDTAEGAEGIRLANFIGRAERTLRNLEAGQVYPVA